jgi:hypothetical protein
MIYAPGLSFLRSFEFMGSIVYATSAASTLYYGVDYGPVVFVIPIVGTALCKLGPCIGEVVGAGGAIARVAHVIGASINRGHVTAVLGAGVGAMTRVILEAYKVRSAREIGLTVGSAISMVVVVLAMEVPVAEPKDAEIEPEQKSLGGKTRRITHIQIQKVHVKRQA